MRRFDTVGLYFGDVGHFDGAKTMVELQHRGFRLPLLSEG